MARALLFSICLPLVLSTSRTETLAALGTQTATYAVVRQIIDALTDIQTGDSDILPAEAYSALAKSVFRLYIDPAREKYTFKTFPFAHALEVPDELNLQSPEGVLFAISNFRLRREILASANDALKAFFKNAKPNTLQPGEKFVLTEVACTEERNYYTAEYGLDSDSGLSDAALLVQKCVMGDLQEINSLWVQMWNLMTEEEQEKYKVSCKEAGTAKKQEEEQKEEDPLQNPKPLPAKEQSSQSDELHNGQSILNIIKEALSDAQNDSLLLVDHDNTLPDTRSVWSHIKTLLSDTRNEILWFFNHNNTPPGGPSIKHTLLGDTGNLLAKHLKPLLSNSAHTELTNTTNNPSNHIALQVFDNLPHLKHHTQKHLTPQYSVPANLLFALMAILYFRRRRDEQNEN